MKLLLFTASLLFLNLIGSASAGDVVEVIKVEPLPVAFEKSSVMKPVTIDSADDLKTYFSDDEAKKVTEAVDFKKQFVVLFAWKGSGRDVINFNILESFPPQVHFVYQPGLTRDLRPHTDVFAVQREILSWKVVKSRPGF